MVGHPALRSGCFMIFLATASVAARADVAYTDTETPSGDKMSVIRMSVTPSPLPVPALRYRFLARDIDLKPGNAAPFYYRAMLDLPRQLEAVRKKYNEEELFKWYGTGAEATPLEQLPLEKVRDAVNMSIGGGVWDQLMEASQRRDCDFQLGLTEVRGLELSSFFLDEFQRSREISRMLAMRTRLAIAERRYDDAIETMRMNYRLARDFGSGPLLICGLVGIAEASITNNTVVEMIAAPDSPNLYWALSELPQPLVDVRAAVRLELDIVPRMFPFLHRAETTARAPQEWNRLFTEMFRELTKFHDGQVPLSAVGSDAVAGVAATVVSLLGYSHAKQQLIAQGMSPEQVEKMAVGQVMAIYTGRHYRRIADQYETLWYMPYWRMRQHAKEIEDDFSRANLLSGAESRELLPLASIFLPAIQAARAAEVRLEREMAVLRVIEALRTYAASHDGKLPQGLEDIQEVPVPMNPATGKPFFYRLEGQTAILELPSSDGIPGSQRRFEIQLATAAK